MRFQKVAGFALLSLILILAVMPIKTYAADKIIPDQDITLTVSYMDMDEPVPNAKYEIYKVADVDEYARMTLTGDFEKYRGQVSGLDDPESIQDNGEWLAIASTLKGYVLIDKLAPVASGVTDENGKLVFTGLKSGLYLVIGFRTTVENFYTYSAVPFMAFLPGLVENDWEYNVTVVPKYTKEFNPPDDPDDISRKVIKVWNDSGFETIRPAAVAVELLRDGTPYDSRILNKDNNWRYAWDNLDPDFEWTIVEDTPEYYSVSTTQMGITFVLQNSYVQPVSGSEIFVQKRLTGETPPSKAPFTFVLSATSTECPMPEGSKDGIKEITIQGAGTIGFGEISFPKQGTYVYTIYEKNVGTHGYTYDSSVYTVSYCVTEKDGKLEVQRTIANNQTSEKDNIVFTNLYGSKLPQTGKVWWPVPLLFLSGIVLVSLGTIVRRRSKE